VEFHAMHPTSDSPETIADVLRTVDRFVFFDADPYDANIKYRDRLHTEFYPTLDHYVKFTEVFLMQTVAFGEDVTHHQDEKYFECNLADLPGKKLEFYYDANFFDIDPKSRLHGLMKDAHVLYLQGCYPGESLYSALPNVDTVLAQEFVKDLKLEKKFKRDSEHQHVQVVYHPSATVCMMDLY
jgi:hypothetical protein